MNSKEDLKVPANILDSAKEVSLNLLPVKSRENYELAYTRFMDWCKEKSCQSYTEDVLMVYFSNLSTKMKPSSLWSQYSMLKSTLDIKNAVDISKYPKLSAFLKRQNKGYQPKKSRIFSKEQVDQFLNAAPDSVYLMTKVVLILGVAGACRSDELVNLTIDNIEDVKSALIIRIPNTKTKRPRSFTVLGDNYLSLYRKYVALRPRELVERRLFVRYMNGKCHRMVVGIHKISAVPQEVAKFLKLENWKEYTGHALRRTSATLLVDAGGDLTCLKRHGGWRSNTVAEGYIEDSLLNKENIAKKILQVGCGNDKPSSTVVASDFTTISDKNLTVDCDESNTSLQNIIVSSAISKNSTNITINENVLDGPGTGMLSKNEGTDTSHSLFTFNTCSNCVFNINVNK